MRELEPAKNNVQQSATVKIFRYVSNIPEKKYEFDVENVTDETIISLLDAQKIFKDARKRYKIKGKLLILKHGDQVYSFNKIREDYEVYILE